MSRVRSPQGVADYGRHRYDYLLIGTFGVAIIEEGLYAFLVDCYHSFGVVVVTRPSFAGPFAGPFGGPVSGHLGETLNGPSGGPLATPLCPTIIWNR